MNVSTPIGRRRFASQLSGISVLAALSTVDSRAEERLVSAPSADRIFCPLDFGAKGDGKAKDTAAIQRAIDACSDAGGGCVYLSPGHTFLSGGLLLRSHVEFHLGPGSCLRASPDRADYHATGALLFAKECEGVSIVGAGTIDGCYPAFFPEKGPDGYSVPQPFLGPYDPLSDKPERNPVDGRPRMILLLKCRNVQMQRFTIRNSPTWTIHPIGCENVLISGISILNDLEVPNCDGIDIDHCRQVRIEGCHIVAGDDCIVLKASRNFGECGPCEAITVVNCTLESSSAGIKIEPEGPFPVKSVVVTNCTLLRCNRGISILNRDGAVVENLIFSDLVITTSLRPLMWWGSGEPIAVSSFSRDAGGNPGKLSNVHFSNIVCKGESGIWVKGSPQAPVENLSFSNVQVIIEKITTIEGGFYDLRPGTAIGPSGKDVRKIAGIFAADVEGMRLSEVDVQWSGKLPDYYGAALELHGCANTRCLRVYGKAASGTVPAILDRVTYIDALPAS